MSAIPTTEYNFNDSLLKSLVKYLSGDNRAGTCPSICVGKPQRDGVRMGRSSSFCHVLKPTCLLFKNN